MLLDREKIKNRLFMYPEDIRYLDNPDEEYQVTALKQNPAVIKLLKKPCLQAQRIAVECDPYLLSAIEKPFEEIILKAISIDPRVIMFSKRRNKFLNNQAMRFAEERGLNFSFAASSPGDKALNFARLYLILMMYYKDGHVENHILDKINDWKSGISYASGITEKTVGEVKNKDVAAEIAVVVANPTGFMRKVLSGVLRVIQNEVDSLPKILAVNSKIHQFALAWNKAKPQAKDLSLSRDLSTYIDKISSVIIRDAPSSYDHVASKVGLVLGSNELLSAFVEEIDSEETSSEDERAFELLKELGQTNLFLTRDEASAAKAKDPDKYKELQGILSSIKEKQRSFIRNFVVSSGQLFLPSSEVNRALSTHFKETIIPDSFYGSLTADYVFTTEFGEPIATKAGAKSAVIPPHAEVEHNPRYTEGSQAWYLRYGTRDTPSKTSFYTKATRVERKADKFKKVGKMITADTINAMRQKWLKHMKSKGTTEDSYDQKILATILELTWHTAARIGSKNKDSGGGGFGIRTLKINTPDSKTLINESQKKIVLKYKGKGQGKSNATVTEQKHILKVNPRDEGTRLLYENIVEFHAGKGNSEYLFTKKDGSIIEYAKIKPYLLKLGFLGGGIHEFRHIQGTKIMTELLEKGKKTIDPNISEGDLKKWVKEKAVAVGEKLGHFSGSENTGSTAINSYIDPLVCADFFAHFQRRVPSDFPQVA